MRLLIILLISINTLLLLILLKFITEMLHLDSNDLLPKLYTKILQIFLHMFLGYWKACYGKYKNVLFWAVVIWVVTLCRWLPTFWRNILLPYPLRWTGGTLPHWLLCMALCSLTIQSITIHIFTTKSENTYQCHFSTVNALKIWIWLTTFYQLLNEI
jgi:hypothetical protein